MSVKHALVVAGEKKPSVSRAVTMVSGFLSHQGFIVDTLSPSSQTEVTDKLAELAAVSCDPNTQPTWSQFLFYFIGHGGSGMMEITDPNTGKAIGTIMTDAVAGAAFGVCVDEWTFVFDMCQAWDAVAWVQSAANTSGKHPQGWILTASGSSTMQSQSHPGFWGGVADFGRWLAELRAFGLERDVSSTQDELYSSAIDECLKGGAGAAADLDHCLWQKRFKDPWWWYKSVTAITPLDYSQPKDVPVF